MNWQEKFVPDAESCVALSTMGMPQKNTTFVWVDIRLLDNCGVSQYKLERTIEAKERGGMMFAAYTAEEMQTLLPPNFMCMHNHDGTWIIIDLFGTKFNTSENDEKNVRSNGVVLSRVNCSMANTQAQAWANAVIFLIQSEAIKAK